MPMIWEGVCTECDAVVEFFSSQADRDAERSHCQADENSRCEGTLSRRPYPSGLAVKWKYGKNDKEGCFMGPSNNIYKTDTTMKRDRQKTRTVNGPSYKGPVTKDKQ